MNSSHATNQKVDMLPAVTAVEQLENFRPPVRQEDDDGGSSLSSRSRSNSELSVDEEKALPPAHEEPEPTRVTVPKPNTRATERNDIVNQRPPSATAIALAYSLSTNLDIDSDTATIQTVPPTRRAQSIRTRTIKWLCWDCILGVICLCPIRDSSIQRQNAKMDELSAADIGVKIETPTCRARCHDGCRAFCKYPEPLLKWFGIDAKGEWFWLALFMAISIGGLIAGTVVGYNEVGQQAFAARIRYSAAQQYQLLDTRVNNNRQIEGFGPYVVLVSVYFTNEYFTGIKCKDVTYKACNTEQECTDVMNTFINEDWIPGMFDYTHQRPPKVEDVCDLVWFDVDYQYTIQTNVEGLMVMTIIGGLFIHALIGIAATMYIDPECVHQNRVVPFDEKMAARVDVPFRGQRNSVVRRERLAPKKPIAAAPAVNMWSIHSPPVGVTPAAPALQHAIVHVKPEPLRAGMVATSERQRRRANSQTFALPTHFTLASDKLAGGLTIPQAGNKNYPRHSVGGEEMIRPAQLLRESDAVRASVSVAH